MTRLTSADIQNIPDRLESYDEELVRITGRDLVGIACHAAGIDRPIAARALKTLTVVSIPFNCGDGIIGDFSGTVARIVAHLGCKASTTQRADVSGIAEALAMGTDLLLITDDNRFVAADIQGCRVIDNAAATGCGYAAGLDLMAKGVKDKTVLVIGCGPVGYSAAAASAAFGARVGLYDIDRRRCEQAAADLRPIATAAPFVVASLPQALERQRLIVEAKHSLAHHSKTVYFPRHLHRRTRHAAGAHPRGPVSGRRTPSSRSAANRGCHDAGAGAAKRLEAKNK